MGSKASAAVTLSCYRDTKSIIRYYQLNTSTPSKPTVKPPSGWSTAEPAYTSGSTKSLYYCDLIEFSDGTFTYSAVNKSSSYQASQEAYVAAQNAQDSVDNLKVGGRNYIRYGKGDSDKGIFSKFASVSDEYGEHTLTSKKQYSNVDISAGFVLGCRDYIVGEKMTWSYDIMFTNWNFPDGATRAEWWFGQRYTNAPSGETASGLWRQVTAHNLPAVGVNGCKLNEWYHVEKTITIPEQASDNVGTASSIQFYNSNADVTASVTFRLKNVKLEYGTRATDWTPAIEDMATAEDADNAQKAANAAQETADTAESLIKQLSDNISMLVTDGNGTSLMTQTDDGWIFSTAELQKVVDATSEGLDNLVNELGSTNNIVNVLQQAVDDLGILTDYIAIGTYEDQPCIELGETDSEFKLRITNTQVVYTEGSTVLAYFTNQSMHIKKAVIEEELQQGNFVWKVRSNGNMGLVWKG